MSLFNASSSRGPRGAPLRGWRRIANAVWEGPNDPQIYGVVQIRARPLLEFIAHARAQGQHITVTHLVGRALGHALEKVPSLNVRLVGGRAVPRGSIDVFFITAMPAGTELSGVKVTDINRKSAALVATELSHGSQRLRQGTDTGLGRAKALMEHVPRPFLRLGIRLAAWAVAERAWSLPKLGLPATPFGSAMVSSVGMLGLPIGFSPLASFYRVPLLILAGEITEQPVVVDGRVEAQPVLPITATVDHRYVDGADLGQALRAFRAYLEAPVAFEPPDSAFTLASPSSRRSGGVL